MISKEKVITWNFIFFVVVSFYSMGAGFVESLANYPVWYILGPSDVWTAYHKALGSKIIPLLAVPALLLQLISNMLLVFFPPGLIPRWTIRATLLLLLIAISSSAVIQIPIQVQLDNGYSKEQIDRLISSDLIFRVGVSVIRNSVIIYMMYILLQALMYSDRNNNKKSSKDYLAQSRKQATPQEGLKC